MAKHETRLTVDAGHPAVHIEVLDCHYRVRAHGYGRVEERLPTGLYTVRYAAADAVEDRDVTLLPDKPVTLREPPDLEFSSSAPIEMTSTSHEYHQADAHKLSRATPDSSHDLGAGSELFLFIRDIDNGEPGGLAEGLTLHDLEGKQLLSFTEVVRRGDTYPQGAPSAGCNLSLGPGSYRLRISLGSKTGAEMVVAVCRNWQSQVFLLRQGGRWAVGNKPVPDLANATHLNAPSYVGFEPSRTSREVNPEKAGEDVRLAELARQALAHGRRGIRGRDLRDMLNGKWQDPLLGIYGVHLLLLRTDPDLRLAERVVKRLARIVDGSTHPDVEILRFEVARRLGKPASLPPWKSPPMLRRSWQMLVRATAEHSELIPRGSLGDQISDQLLGTGAWLIWEVPAAAPSADQAAEAEKIDWLQQTFTPGNQPAPPRIHKYEDRVVVGGVTLFKRGVDRVPDDALPPPATMTKFDEVARDDQTVDAVRGLVEAKDLSRERLTTLDHAATRSTIEALLPNVDDLIQRAGIDDLADKAGFDPTEYALLVHLNGILVRRRSRQGESRDPLAFETLVDRLNLPRGRLQTTVSGFILKLLAVLSGVQ